MTRRAAIYARISLDRKEGAGVARQLADCRSLATERGYEVVGEYVDNDVSAVRAKRRPEWERLIADLDRVDVLVAYHPDRLYRRARDLEDLIDATEGVEIVTVKAGDMDLGDATGRMLARLLGATSRHESDRMGERVARAKKDRAARGLPPGGGMRAFGWQNDKITLEPKEAAALKAAAERVAAGASVSGEARALNAAGFTTTGGALWDPKSLARVLRAPRIAGLRDYRGEIVGTAAWAPIIDEATWRRLALMIEGRRNERGPRQPSLLSALITCPRCGGKLYKAAGRRGYPNYACAPATRQGCGGASISVEHADAKVTAEIGAYLDDPHIPGWLHEPAPLNTGEADALEQKRIDLTRRWAAGKITDDEYDAGRAVLTERLDELEQGPKPTLAVGLEELRRAWAKGSTEARRAVVLALVERIELAPGRAADPRERVTVHFRQ